MYRVNTIWLPCSGRLHVVYRDINDHHKKFGMEFDSFSFWADYKINISIDGVDSYILDNVFKTLRLTMNNGNIIGFNYSDIAGLPNLVLRYGFCNDSIFWFTIQRDHIRNVHVLLDPSYVILYSTKDPATGENTQRLTTRSRNGTIFVSYSDALHSCINKSYDNGSTWITVNEPIYNDQYPYSLAFLANDTLVAMWQSNTTYYINYSMSHDYGQTWSSQMPISNHTYAAYMPCMVVDGYDNIHVAWYGYTATSLSYFSVQYRRYVAGVGWDNVQTVATASNSHSIEPSMFVDNSNNIHLAYRSASNYIRYIYNNNNGASGSWSASVVAYQNPVTARAMQKPSIVVDSLYNVWITMVGRYSTTASQVKVWVVNSSTFGVSWGAVSDLSAYDAYQYNPSIGLSGNDMKYVAWDGYTSGNAHRVIHYSYTINNVWQAEALLTTPDAFEDYYPNILSARFPKYYGTCTALPSHGFCFLYSDDANISFYVSADFSWDTLVPYSSNVTFSNWYPVNDTVYSVSYLRMPLLNFSVDVNDDWGYSTYLRFWVEDVLVYTSGYGANRTVLINLSKYWWSFNFTLGTHYNFTVNGTDINGYYKNETHQFSYVTHDQINGLVVVENLYETVGTSEYIFSPFTGLNGEWWVWANYTGWSSALNIIDNFINATGYHDQHYNTVTGWTVYANITGNGTGGASITNVFTSSMMSYSLLFVVPFCCGFLFLWRRQKKKNT